MGEFIVDLSGGRAFGAMVFGARFILGWTLVSFGCGHASGRLPRGGSGAGARAGCSRGAHGHFATGGSDISTASGLWPVSSPNFVPRS